MKPDGVRLGGNFRNQEVESRYDPAQATPKVSLNTASKFFLPGNHEIPPSPFERRTTYTCFKFQELFLPNLGTQRNVPIFGTCKRPFTAQIMPGFGSGSAKSEKKKG